MSLNRTPGFGKSGMSRMYWVRSMVGATWFRTVAFVLADPGKSGGGRLAATRSAAQGSAGGTHELDDPAGDAGRRGRAGRVQRRPGVGDGAEAARPGRAHDRGP